ncbi:MAG: amylo-alpha-1,6-glucosidase [Chloroflexi bacterium]|nr:amylo-alpha-1,6-glucosidase [Chloroflexota bacterium]
MPAEVTVGPPVLTINHGSTFMVTDRQGEIRPNDELGVFAADTRFLSYYRCTIERQPWTLLTSTTPMYYQARLVYMNPLIPPLDTRLPRTNYPLPGVRGGIPAGQVSLIVTRTVNGRISEQLEITNHGRQAVRFHLELALRSDFVDLFDVKAHRYYARGETATTWQANAESWDLVTDYRNADFQRRFIYRIRRTDSPPAYANGRIIWLVTVPPAGAWRAEAVMILDAGQGEAAPPPGCSFDMARAAQDFRTRVAQVRTSNTDVAATAQQSIADMAALRFHDADMPEEEWVPAAGVPWFVTLFGRDSLIVSYQCMGYYTALARGTLRRLAQYQATERDDWRDAQPGKIPHELRHGELAHFHLIPHTPYYGTWDATPLYLIVLHETWRWTGDRGLLETYLPTAERCLEWIDRYGDLDGDGFQEYQTYSNQGYDNMSWKDSGNCVVYPDGSLVPQPKALCELQGYVYDAKRRLAEIYRVLGQPDRASELERQAATLRAAFNARFWLDELETFAFGLDPHKRPIASVASNPGHCLWTGIAEPDKAARVVRRLLQPDMWSGWGIRTLSAQHPAYNPFDYQVGAVWPHDNSLLAAGFKRYGFAAEASQVARGIFDAAAYFESHRLPEVFAGADRAATTFPVQYLGANIPQAWAAGSVFLLLRTLLGLRADAPNGRLYVHPTLPDWLPDVELTNLQVGGARLDLRAWQSGETSHWEVTRHEGPEIEVIAAPATPDAL